MHLKRGNKSSCNCLYFKILTAADDKTVRLFDVASGQEVNRMDIPSNPTDLELSQDSSVITVSFGELAQRRNDCRAASHSLLIMYMLS